MKKLLMVLLAIMLCVTLVGCSSQQDSSSSGAVSPELDYSVGNGTTDVPSGGVDDYTIDRLMIYTVDISLETEDTDALYALIKGSMSSGEWCDREYIRDSYMSLTVRISSDRLDEFIQDISAGDAEVTSYSKTADDITDDYYDIESRINTLTIEQTTLLSLLDDDDISLTDTLAIVERLSEIQGTLDVLNGELSSYDSLVNYSTVNIYIYGVGDTPSTVTLGDRLGDTFVSAWVAVCDVFQFILVAIVAVVPFLLIIVPVGVGVFFLVRHIRKKKRARATGEPVVHGDTQQED